MDEMAIAQLVDALNDLRQEIETLNSRVSALTQSTDDLRGELMIARRGGDSD